MDLAPLLTSVAFLVDAVAKRIPRHTWPNRAEMTAPGVAVSALSAAEAMTEAHGFIFDDDASWEHIEFGAQLLNRGLFRMPYAKTAIRFQMHDIEDKFNSGAPLAHGFAFIDQLTSADRPATWFMLSAIRRSDWRELGTPEWFINGMLNFRERVTFNGDGTFALTAAEFPVWLVMGDASGPRLDAQKERFTMDSRLMAMSVIGLVTSLMSPEVTSKLVPPALKLNIHRAKTGKPPLIEHRIVHLKAVNGNSGGHHRRIGERRPPRLHWRRGHFRTLSHGRIIPVAPAIVGSASRGMIMKDYVVHGEGD
jgi:hypothetical protein